MKKVLKIKDIKTIIQNLNENEDTIELNELIDLIDNKIPTKEELLEEFKQKLIQTEQNQSKRIYITPKRLKIWIKSLEKQEV